VHRTVAIGEGLVDNKYPDAEKIILVMENLDTHDIAEIELLALGRQYLASR